MSFGKNEYQDDSLSMAVRNVTYSGNVPLESFEIKTNKSGKAFYKASMKLEHLKDFRDFLGHAINQLEKYQLDEGLEI